MNYTTYILYSKSNEGYYTGSTSMPIDQRLKRHNSNHRGYSTTYSLYFRQIMKDDELG